MVTLDIPREYGYVVLVAGASHIINMWQAMKVGSARRRYNIKYPAMYSDSNILFNCIQRAHQNFLENHTSFLTYLLLGGLEAPVFCAAAGGVWLLARIVYAVGYSTGDPSKRNYGAFQYFPLFALLFNTFKFGARLVGWI